MSFFNIHIIRSQYLSNLNMWAYKSVLENIIDINDFEHFPSNHFPELIDKIQHNLPSIKLHKCGNGIAGSFIQRMKEGTWIGHILEHVIIELLNCAGLNVTFGQTRSTSLGKGKYFMVFQCPNEQVARTALQEGLNLILNLFHEKTYDLNESIEKIKFAINTFHFGASTNLIVQSADAQKIPYIRPTECNWIQFGFGKYSNYYVPGITEQVNSISVSISQNKTLSKEILNRFGLSTAEGFIASSIQEVTNAFDIWESVTIKPESSNRSHGISLQITNQDDYIQAFEIAKQYSENVIVEKFYAGNDFRLYLIEHEVVAAQKGFPLSIIGNGIHSIKELITQLNQNLNLGDNDYYTILEIEFDDILQIQLKKQSVKLDTILPLGDTIEVRKNLNTSIGIEINEIHPDIIQQASLATKLLKLPIAGIDLIAQDISKPLAPDNGAFLEINAGPALYTHHYPINGKIYPVADYLIKYLIQKTNIYQFKMICVCGTHIANETMQNLVRYFKKQSKNIGWANENGIFFNDQLINREPKTLEQTYSILLMNRFIDTAILSATPSSLRNYGLPKAKYLYRATIMLDVDNQHEFSKHIIGDQSMLLKIMRTPVDALEENGYFILNADNPFILELSQYSVAKNLFITLQDKIDHLIPFKKEGDYIVQYQNEHSFTIHSTNNIKIVAGQFNKNSFYSDVLEPLFENFIQVNQHHAI